MKSKETIPLERKLCGLCQMSKPVTSFKNTKRLPHNLCLACIDNIGGLEYAKIRYKGVSEIKMLDVAIETLERIKKAPHKRRSQEPGYVRKQTDNIREFKERFPEKAEAWLAIAGHIRPKGYHLHHWSYNRQHYEDVIPVLGKYHARLHSFIIYDPETKMYRDKQSGFLLNTKSLHAAFLDLCYKAYILTDHNAQALESSQKSPEPQIRRA